MATYTSLVLRPLELKLPRGNPLMAANFKTATIAAKTRVNMRPLNPIPPFIGLSSTRRTAVSVSKSSPSSTLTDDGNCNGNPCLDLFLNFRDAEKAGAGRNHLEELLSLAWSHNPLTALKLIYKILQDYSFGTGEEDTFRTVTFWLHNNHPKTLARNVAPIAGFFLYFLQFCFLLSPHLDLEGERQSKLIGDITLIAYERAHDIEGQDVSQQHQQNAAVVERYEHDPEYRFFHEFISDIFVECLKSDIEKLKKKNLKQPNDDQDNWWKITSAADSCLSLGNNFSDSALLLQSIARKVFPRESYPEYQGVEEAEYADSVRDRLKKEVLLPMDKLDEAYKYYDSTDDTYLEKLKARQKYWENLKVDKSKIEADALLPHQILSYVNHWNFALAELQWKAMVEGIKKQGKLNGKKIINNCLALCDVASMLDSHMQNLLMVKLPRSNPLMAANFKTATIAAKTRVNMRPLNPIPPFIGLSTATGSNRRTAAPASISEFSSTVPDDGNCNGKPCLDLFFLNFRDAEEAGRNRMEELLSLAWSHNPLTTLKVIYKILLEHHDEIFRTMTIWLHQNHPKTLSCNIEPIAGLFVDFWQFCKLLNVHLVLKDGRQVVEGGFPRIRFETSHDLDQGQDVRQQKQMAVERYERDPENRFLHEFISDIFAECLKSDIEKLKHQNLKHSDDYDDEKDNWSKITDAATSCLSMGTNFNDPTLLRQSIARKVFPRESYPEYQGVEETDYADSVLDRLRKEVLLPLDKLDKAYESQDSVVEKYLEEVKAGKSKIAPDALLPHQIIRYVNHWNFGQVAELQWKAMVEGIKKQGKLNGKKILNNCLAVCNLRYMFKPGMRSMDASVGFALLMSELNEEPWKGKVIHFGSDPQLHLIKGDELTYRCDFLTRRVPWCWKVDFEKVLDLILEEAVNGNLKPEQMIKKVFVFTDSTDFDNARSKPNNEESDDEDSDNSWKTIYEGIQRKYKEKGYDNAVPHIMYWKMWSCLSDPRWWVKSSEQPGVTMLEGTADNLLKLVLDNGGEISLDLIMEATISGKEYQKLLVVD